MIVYFVHGKKISEFSDENLRKKIGRPLTVMQKITIGGVF